MGVGLYLIGRRSRSVLPGKRSGEAFVKRIESWARERLLDARVTFVPSRERGAGACLYLALHPSAEDVEVWTEGDDGVIASAKTSTTGPGYHILVCELLDRLGRDLGVSWLPAAADESTGDETGYFHDRDESALRAVMLRWLGGVARLILERQMLSAMLSLPLDHIYDHDGAVATPLGPRNRAWIEAVSDEPEEGMDIFPWWERGAGPAMRLNRALCRMWTDVRWRVPFNEREDDVLRLVLDDLAAAHAEAPELAYPWREWNELLGYATRDGPLAPMIASRAVGTAPGPLVGYRRRDVRVDLTSGWSILVPGSFAEAWEDDGGTWVAWDQTRTVRVTTLSIGAKGAPAEPEAILGPSKPDDAAVQRFDYRDRWLLGRASLVPTEENGKRFWRLTGESAIPGGLGIVTVFFDDEADRDWALGTWKSLAHPAPDARAGA